MGRRGGGDIRGVMLYTVKSGKTLYNETWISSLNMTLNLCSDIYLSRFKIHLTFAMVLLLRTPCARILHH